MLYGWKPAYFTHSSSSTVLYTSRGALILTFAIINSTAYEHGYKVYTVKDACGATSPAAHDSTFEHNFGMFSIPTKTDELLEAIQVS